MANSKQHGFISKTMGLSLGFLGIVGLVVSLISLLPVNVYNLFITIHALTELLRYELPNNTDWWTLSPDGTIYSVFLTGSILSSLITIFMVIITCFRQQRSDNGQMVSHGPLEEQDPQDIESHTALLSTTTTTGTKRRSSVWLSRIGCLIFVGQISWALFGTHLLFFYKAELPESIHRSAMISTLILWLNYLIITIFSFILFCASFFIILGARRSSSSNDRPYHHHNHHHSHSNTPSTSAEEMQYHREETTPLLHTSSVRTT
ncbi:hypothetical protein BDA99DRAFT_540259 [Phascolomyces articulosus]|uniref:Transmembrane protein n=1 Tax=Phascolomyces articulosus TaxID=60185 RepID=A0AAD5JU32_9FUNG|nr:hypothetical protein BDA99DRAFT_540259 [Phascolomyces articulosus]